MEYISLKSTEYLDNFFKILIRNIKNIFLELNNIISFNSMGFMVLLVLYSFNMNEAKYFLYYFFYKIMLINTKVEFLVFSLFMKTYAFYFVLYCIFTSIFSLLFIFVFKYILKLNIILELKGFIGIESKNTSIINKIDMLEKYDMTYFIQNNPNPFIKRLIVFLFFYFLMKAKKELIIFLLMTELINFLLSLKLKETITNIRSILDKDASYLDIFSKSYLVYKDKNDNFIIDIFSTELADHIFPLALYILKISLIHNFTIFFNMNQLFSFTRLLLDLPIFFSSIIHILDIYFNNFNYLYFFSILLFTKYLI